MWVFRVRGIQDLPRITWKRRKRTVFGIPIIMEYPKRKTKFHRRRRQYRCSCQTEGRAWLERMR